MISQPNYHIPDLPPKPLVETLAILRAAARAHQYLGELKGAANSIPNAGILIDSLALQEAKASSEIESIVTTQDELFQLDLYPDGPATADAKEVARYRDSLKLGFSELQANQGLLTNNMIIAMFQLLKRTNGEFRDRPGTVIVNEASGAHVHVPPQDKQQILKNMAELERFINEPENCDLDPLIKMAIIHHQFESIHPFPDGNGRIGRIINVLYLTREGLLDLPILYLSRYITRNKSAYYALLQSVRDTQEWEPWVIYMLNGVAETARDTIRLISGLKALMARYKAQIRTNHPRIYSQDLLNNLFRHPYTRTESVMEDLKISRPTATNYLEKLTVAGLLEKQKIGRNVYYINRPLVELFVEGS